jgi:hypothetical protein
MALVIDIAVPLTHNLPITEAQKIIKYENLALEIKNIWKLNNVSIHTLVILGKRVVTKNSLKYLENIGLTKHSLRVGQKTVLLQTHHTVSKFLV